ncbi:hypothetical protein GQ53DRAFT_837492 [Thozetella sp. PMI_491]|nr:hypothetical protein GQ53DRAFT_837492 [Thozetella sp. PMI_491]
MASLATIGVDVGGTNTDAVLIRDNQVLAWHKTPSTADIQTSVEHAISEVISKSNVDTAELGSVKIGTTQFINAVLEQDGSKLDKVAVIRICGPYSRGSPPFVDFPAGLRALVEGHFDYVDGGYQVDGRPISALDVGQLKEQASIIKEKSIRSIVVIGIYSPSDPRQEEEAASYLLSELGAGYEITCSHKVGRLGFLERENASILNASLRRFARHVISGYRLAARRLGIRNLYITLNDGTLSKAADAAECPVRCFQSGPTNSARGAAFLAQLDHGSESGEKEILVMDVGGTTTDICALLKGGFPRQSAAFVKIGGVRTNFTIPAVHSIALGGGSYVREHSGVVTIGPDSVGSNLTKEGIFFGGKTLTATDLVLSNGLTQGISPQIKSSSLLEIKKAVEAAIDLAKSKQGDAIVVLVGGGSIIIDNNLAGVDSLVRPKYFDVANAVGAAIGKISGSVDTIGIPDRKSIDEIVQDAKALAIERCVAAGGGRDTAEIVEVDVLPVSYVTNGATRIIVRAVSDLSDSSEVEESAQDDETQFPNDLGAEAFQKPAPSIAKGSSASGDVTGKTVPNVASESFDPEAYKPDIRGDLWYISEIDLQFLQDGTGVLGVGSCGEPYPTYVACLNELRNGKEITIRRQSSVQDDTVVLVAGFMGSPSVYLERVPGKNEITDAITAVTAAGNLSTFDSIIPNEIGGMNSFEALVAASRLGKSVLDTDCVARAYPYLWQTVRCLNGVSVTPAAVADGAGNKKVMAISRDELHAEEVLREACSDLGSLSGICINPVRGPEARTLPKNSFSYAWTIGYTLALSRCRKQDPAMNLVREHNGAILFSGKIVSVTRTVSKGFTRGSVLLESSEEDGISKSEKKSLLHVDFENENLCALRKDHGQEYKVVAVCPDLITFLDKANGAPLGISDYKYGLRVSVIALRAPPFWVSEQGLKVGGPTAFGLDHKYTPISSGPFHDPLSVWDMFVDE